MPGQQLIVDLGAVRLVTGLELSLGAFGIDFPRRLLVEASQDQQKWATLWEGDTGGRALIGTIEDPRRRPLRFLVPAVATRYLRLTQLGRDPEFHWSVAELTVFGRETQAAAQHSWSESER